MRAHLSKSIFVFGMLLVASLGHIGGQPSYQELNPQVYCGRTLARALALLCYDDMNPEKRSDSGTMYNTVLSPYYKNQEPHTWPWMPSYKAMGMSSHRGKRLVVNECCDKPCSLNELLSYC